MEWSGGLSCGGSISCGAWRSRSWCGGWGCRATRSGVALRSEVPPRYQRPGRPSKLDAFKDEIHELLRRDPRLPAVRVRELIEPLGFVGGKTIVNEYVREVRPLFVRPRTFQRTVYRPGEICQFDLWHASSEVPVGHGQIAQGVCRGGVPGVFPGGRGRIGLRQGGA